MKHSQLLGELRAFLFPEKKWHYWFHVAVIVVALAYWVTSILKFPDASWSELVMYRPKGDNQVFPIVAALSRFNFGDPTDALNYGRGLAGFQAVILFPYVLAYALFGPAGYMLADVALCWLYFMAATLLLRRCQFGNLASLLVASALATGSLQNLCSKLNEVISKPLAICGLFMSDWEFPALLQLPIFLKRIPRPIVTEILVVLLLYFLVRQWQECRRLSFKGGLAIGALLALLAQGDPYSLSAIGLVLIVVVWKTLAHHQWRIPWNFGGGAALGALGAGSFFILQLFSQSPEGATRFGLANYSRSHLLLLPGYGPTLRVVVVGLLAGMVLVATRRGKEALHAQAPRKALRPTGLSPAASFLSRKLEDLSGEGSLALFCVALVAAGWLAQPLQLLLLGKGVQIYHYLLYTLPTLYAYALVILGFHLVRLAVPRLPEGLRLERGHSWVGAMLLGTGLILETSLGIEDSLDTMMSAGTSRQEVSPWLGLGDRYRPGFRALEQQFRENETLLKARSFATYCHEVNFLLAGFFDKRAYLPDNAYALLSDAELERRLCEMSKICGFHPDDFAQLIQHKMTMNYWLGCAKYWCASDHKFAPENDYPPEQLEAAKKQPKQAPFNLVLPISEINRLVNKYASILGQKSEISQYPDVIVMTSVLKKQGIVPAPQLYREIYTNEVFSIHAKILHDGFFVRN